MRIFKYPLVTFDDTFFIPKGATFAHVAAQNEVITLWMMVDATQPVEKRRFKIFPTGLEINSSKFTYLGTVLQAEGAFVWHVFEEH